MPQAEREPSQRDFSYERGENPVPSGAVTKIRANIAAIKLSKQLREEDRVATPDEKKVLAAYSGWGGAKEVFNETWGIPFTRGGDGWYNGYDEYKSWVKNYSAYYKELKELLTKEEWDAASQSVLNAHYTSPDVCHALWDAVKHLGFEKGKVLEPSCGTGLILGAMPADLRDSCKVYGVELDNLTAGISQKLFPGADIAQCDFFLCDVPDNSIDLVVGNVPFSDVAPADQRGDIKMNLHNAFIREGFAKLKNGGVMAVITSASTMENNPGQRAELAKHGKLIGAIRLPNNAFKDVANTEVVTDILFFTKGEKVQMNFERFTETTVVNVDHPFVNEDDGKKYDTAFVNEYFYRHPEMVLGEHSLCGKMYGASEKGQYTVESPKGAPDIAERLEKAIQNLPEGVLQNQMAATVEESESEGETNFAPFNAKLGAFCRMENGDIQQVVGGPSKRNILGLVPWKKKSNPLSLPKGFTDGRAMELASDFIDLRDKYADLIRTDQLVVTTESESSQSRVALKDQYDFFVKKWGYLNADKTVIGKVLRSDPDWGTLRALERVRELPDGTIQINPAPILTQRTLWPSAQPTQANTIEDALMIGFSQNGRLTTDIIAKYLSVEPSDELDKLIMETGLAYVNPNNGLLESRAKYLSGDVVSKLEEAEIAADKDPKYIMNVGALKSVQPAPLTIDVIRYPLGAAWLPPEVVNNFARKIFDDRNFKVTYLAPLCEWRKVADYSSWGREDKWDAKGESGEKIMEADDLLINVLNNTPISVYETIGTGEDKQRVFNAAKTEIARAAAVRLQDAFQEYVKNSQPTQELLVKVANEKFNRFHNAEYDGSKLTFPGLATGKGCLDPFGHQRAVTERMIEEQGGLIAHDVGFGKTASLCLTAMKSKQLGLARKPVLICDNASYGQFVETLRSLYPAGNFLVADDDDFSPQERHEFLAKATTGDWDVVCIKRSQFQRIPHSESAYTSYYSDTITELQECLTAIGEDGDKKTHRQIAKRIESSKEKLKARIETLRTKADKSLKWEDCGFDLMLVDETHNYKKPGITTRRRNLKGLDVNQSEIGLSMLLACKSVQERRQDRRGVVFATATPVSNTMMEVYSQLRMCRPDLLESFHVTRADEFLSTFCGTESNLELNEGSGRWREIERLTKYIMFGQLSTMVRQGLDIQMDKKKLNLAVPEIRGGKPQFRILPKSASLAAIEEQIKNVYATWENMGAEKKDFSHVPLLCIMAGAAASIDPRLVTPEADVSSEKTVVNVAVDDAVKLWKESNGTVSQAFFLDRYSDLSFASIESLGGFKPMELEEIKSVDDEAAEKKGAKAKKEDGEDERVNKIHLYKILRDRLIANGIPKEKIALITDCKNDDERLALMKRLNNDRLVDVLNKKQKAVESRASASELKRLNAEIEEAKKGGVDFVIGGSKKLGTGLSFQRRLAAARHLDPPSDMMPGSMTQRNGRILRMGNIHKEVDVVYYGVQDSISAAIFNRIAVKEYFISQLLTGRVVGTEIESNSDTSYHEFVGHLQTATVRDWKEAVVQLKEMEKQVMLERTRIMQVDADVKKYEIDITNQTNLVLPNAIKRKEFFEKNIKVSPEKVEYVDLNGLKHEGKEKEIIDQINGEIKTWKKQPLTDGKLYKHSFGKIKVNGLELNIEGRPGLLTENVCSSLIVAHKDPVSGGNRDERIFDYAKNLISYVEARHADSMASVSIINDDIKIKNERLAKLHEARKELKPVDYEALENLRKKADELKQKVLAEQEAISKDRAERVKVVKETKSIKAVEDEAVGLKV